MAHFITKVIRISFPSVRKHNCGSLKQKYNGIFLNMKTNVSKVLDKFKKEAGNA